MSADQGSGKATPLALLPVVLGAYEEAGKLKIHIRLVDLILADVRDEAELLLAREPEMDATDALLRAVVAVRPIFARHMAKQGQFLWKRDEITRDAEDRIWQVAKSGPHGE